MDNCAFPLSLTCNYCRSDNWKLLIRMYRILWHNPYDSLSLSIIDLWLYELCWFGYWKTRVFRVLIDTLAVELTCFIGGISFSRMLSVETCDLTEQFSKMISIDDTCNLSVILKSKCYLRAFIVWFQCWNGQLNTKQYRKDRYWMKLTIA